MELVNLCPLRVAGALRPSTSGLQFSVIACGTLVRRPDGALDLAATQRAPDVDDLQWLEPRGPQSRAPSSDRKVPGRVVAGGAFFAFDGVPRDLQKQRVVQMRPKLFVQEAHGAREVVLDVVSVAYDGEAHEVSVVWRGQSPLDAETADGRAVVALERGGEKTVWAELGPGVDGLLSSPTCERLFIEAEPTLSEIGEATVSLGPGEVRERFGESPLPFTPPSQPSPDWVDPEHLATMRISAIPDVVDRRSIGQILADRPSFARPDRRPLDDEPDRPANGAVPAKRAAEGFALDLLWHADGASARLRKQPDLKRLILASRPPNDEVRETHDIASVAKGAAPTRLEGIGASMDAAIHEGILEAPALVIDGTIALAFEPVEMLRALVGAARALIKPNEKLSKALTSAESVTKGELEDAAWALAEPETARLREAIGAAARPEIAKAVEEAVDRKLTRDKKIVAVTVLGAPHFVAHISAEGDPARNIAAVYLPLPAADRWPLVRRFPARLIAEAHASFDDREPGAAALVGLAIYRRVPRAA